MSKTLILADDVNHHGIQAGGFTRVRMKHLAVLVFLLINYQAAIASEALYY